ncbi:MAG: hypothetical protein JXA20_05355 [Spirochaetes bacterium]|nr:hypothetical protein [Spirochaetota bacterium]
MNITNDDFSIVFDEAQRSIVFKGSLRLLNVKEYEPVKSLLSAAHDKSTGQLTLDFRDLKFLNSSGITTISTFVINSRNSNKLKLEVLGSKSISWQEKSLINLNKLWSEVNVVLS